MTRSSLVCNITWAVGTFGLALAFGIPAVSNAVDDSTAAGWTQAILNPSMTISGIRLSVSTANPSTQPSVPLSDQSDRRITLLIHAINPLPVSASGTFKISLTSVAPSIVGSRVMPMPTEIWNDSGLVALDPGQTKTVAFTPPPLPINRWITVVLTADNQTLPMMTLVARPDGLVSAFP